MYTQSITRNHRTAFIILIDGSGSMAERTRFRGHDTTKAEAVAAIANDLIFELVERARRSDGVRDYYDIALLGYSGESSVEGLLPDGQRMASVAELDRMEVPVVHHSVSYDYPDGRRMIHTMPQRQWIKPKSEGQTPMCEALRTAREIAAEWVARPENADSFPPVVFNLTDGEATDGHNDELIAVAERIRSLATNDGNVLLINIHITTAQQSPLFCPTDEEMADTARLTRVLYEASSEMPACFETAIREVKGCGCMPPFRGMAFNATASEVITMLNIGSISVKTE